MNEDGSVIPAEIFVHYANQNFLRNNDKIFVGVLNASDTEIAITDDGIPVIFYASIFC